jgi:hypothetical protein
MMWFELSRNRIAGELSLAWLADLLELPHSVAKKLDLLADLLWVGLPGSGIAVFLNQAGVVLAQKLLIVRYEVTVSVEDVLRAPRVKSSAAS